MRQQFNHFSMRFVSLLLLQLSILTTHASINQGYARFFEEADLQTLSAALSGETDVDQRFRTVVTSGKNITGNYFILDAEELPAGVTSANLTWIPSNSKDSSSTTFSLPTNTNRWIYLGLTDTPWNGSDVKFLAWKVEFLGKNGEVLADWKSFLWELP